MSTRFSLDDLYATMRDVFGVHRFEFRPDMTAADVPGWNSLNHTVLLMEIEAQTGVELTAAETVDLPNIAALHELIVGQMTGGG